jgi:formate/nitrite transporter FocA (FNT family)
VFSLGLILVLIAGSELLTGNMALVPMAAFQGARPSRGSRGTWRSSCSAT